ncbi:MAG: tol-pal system protein YbgF [Phenylobacterium sp.]
MSFRRIAALTSVAVLAVATAAPMLAQTPMPDPLDARDAKRIDKMEKVVRELRAIVFQGRDTGKPVVVQPAETDYQVQDLARRLSDLEKSLTRMNGQLESATFELDQAKQRAEALQAANQTLTARLTALEEKAAAPPPAPVAAADPQADFAQARQRIEDGDYDGAEEAFESFLEDHPNSSRVGEARYWLGKARAVRNAHADAASAYLDAIDGWPKTSWAPDAVVELSRELTALKRTTQACQVLAELGKRYPNAPSGVKSRAASTRAQAKCA